MCMVDVKSRGRARVGDRRADRGLAAGERFGSGAQDRSGRWRIDQRGSGWACHRSTAFRGCFKTRYAQRGRQKRRSEYIPTLSVRFNWRLTGKEPRRVAPNYRRSLCPERYLLFQPQRSSAPHLKLTLPTKAARNFPANYVAGGASKSASTELNRMAQFPRRA